jgi:prolyl-tRNA editing enzyme YbaK/EbsC (Cys-tRNA(Pro) deacylase)
LTELPAAARRVQATLAAAGSQATVIELPDSARTAEEAAAAVGCPVGAIVKSLVFRGEASGGLWLILASGSNRVHEKRLGRLLGDPLVRADADAVRAATGYAIGGVPPLAHATALPAVMDEALLGYEAVWAAAGTPRCVFRAAPQEIAQMTGARIAPII